MVLCKYCKYCVKNKLDILIDKCISIIIDFITYYKFSFSCLYRLKYISRQTSEKLDDINLNGNPNKLQIIQKKIKLLNYKFSVKTIQRSCEVFL